MACFVCPPALSSLQFDCKYALFGGIDPVLTFDRCDCRGWHSRIGSGESTLRKFQNQCRRSGSCRVHLQNSTNPSLMNRSEIHQGQNRIRDLAILTPGLALSTWNNDSYDWVLFNSPLSRFSPTLTIS